MRRTVIGGFVFDAMSLRARRYFQSPVSLSTCTAIIGPPSFHHSPCTCAARAEYQSDAHARYFGSVVRKLPHSVKTQSGCPPLRASPWSQGPTRRRTLSPSSAAMARNSETFRRPSHVKTPRASSWWIQKTYTAIMSRPPARMRMSCSRHADSGRRAKCTSPEVGYHAVLFSVKPFEFAPTTSPVFGLRDAAASSVNGSGFAAGTASGSVARRGPLGSVGGAVGVTTAIPPTQPAIGLHVGALAMSMPSQQLGGSGGVGSKFQTVHLSTPWAQHAASHAAGVLMGWPISSAGAGESPKHSTPLKFRGYVQASAARVRRKNMVISSHSFLFVRT